MKVLTCPFLLNSLIAAAVAAATMIRQVNCFTIVPPPAARKHHHNHNKSSSTTRTCSRTRAPHTDICNSPLPHSSISVSASASTHGTSSTTSITSMSMSTSTSTDKYQNFRQPTTIPDTSTPLSKNTYAGKVEKAIISKYGYDDTVRVVQSWRLLDKDYEHREYVGAAATATTAENSSNDNNNNNNNIDPMQSNCYQYTNSYVDGLTCVPFWDVNKQSWAKKLSNKHKTIRKEFLNVISNKEKLSQGNNVWAGALTEEAGGYGVGWSTLVLKNRGMWDETNCNLFPQTAKAIHNSGIPATEVFFASMKPHSDIKLHSDFTNFVLTSHLAVDIPESGANKCRLTVGDDTREWINGEVMLFDTSIMHDAVNESDDMRYILMFRVWHPGLTEVEQNALQLIYDCLEIPDLLSEDKVTRDAAEEEIAKLRTFPKLQTSTSGFGSGVASGGGSSKKKKKGRK